MEFKLLYDIIIIFALSIVILFVFHKLKIPPIIGFLLTGLISGPYGFGLVKSVHEVEVLAEIGILLLLFTIGIEFSLKEILQLKKSVFFGGSLQVILTIAITALIINFSAVNLNEAVFIGFLVALSSTAILLKIYSETGEIETPHGRVLLSILIFQDIIVVVMILFTPILSGTSGDLFNSLLFLLIKTIGVILFVYLGTKFLVPFVLHQVARTKSRELFLFTILVICFGIVWATGELGLSLALGAFLAGLIISESEYSHQALSHVMPFRDAFSSLFFVSIGMLLDIQNLFDNLLLALSISALVILIKSLLGLSAVKILGYPWRVALIVGFALAQVGEFSFILAKTGMSYGFLGENFYQQFLSVSILTMAVTPLLLKIGPMLGDKLGKLLNDSVILRTNKFDSSGLKDHLIIVGYGINGKNLVKAATFAKIPYVIVEMNPDTIKEEKAKGSNIIYGDAVYPGILNQAKIKEARIIVIAINDPTSVQKIVAQVKAINPNIYIIVRTRHVKEVDRLKQLSADEVIPEEFETSIEIFSRVLSKYLIPRNEIEKLVDEIRSDNYDMFRNLQSESPLRNLQIRFPELEVCSFEISKNSKYENKNLAELDFRNKHGFSIVAIQRGNEVIGNPSATESLKKDDIVFILTKHENIPQIAEVFKDERREN